VNIPGLNTVIPTGNPEFLKAVILFTFWMIQALS